MHRLLLKNLLNAYDPQDPFEKQCKLDMLSFLSSEPDCFERSLHLGHFTASAWLLNGDRSKALMMHHAKLGIWVQLGGHCDGEADVLKVAIKEAEEESGLEGVKPVVETIFDLDIHLIPENKNQAAHYHYDVRFLLEAKNELVKKNEESKQLLWVDCNESKLPTKDRSILRMFHKWQNLSDSTLQLI